MCIVPSVSHDYRLVILGLPVAVCLSHFAIGYLYRGHGLMIAGFGAILTCFLLLNRSILYPPLLGVQNMYPAVFAVQIGAYLASATMRTTVVETSAPSIEKNAGLESQSGKLS